MSCCCESQFPLLGGLLTPPLMGAVGLTAGSRVLYQGETEGGLLDTGSLIDEFKRFLQQRGLRVENVTYEGLGVTWTGSRMIRVWAQVVTPIDRAREDDLTYDMTQDLQRASNAPVENASLSVMVRAGKDSQGNPTYPGGGTSLPTTPPPGDDPNKKSIWDEISEMLDVTKDTAQAITVGGAALLLILLLKR